MEIYMIKSRFQQFGLVSDSDKSTDPTMATVTTSNSYHNPAADERRLPVNSIAEVAETTTAVAATTLITASTSISTTMSTSLDNDSFIHFIENATDYINNSLLVWNGMDNETRVFFAGNGSESDSSNSSMNATGMIDNDGTATWSFCFEWVSAQHNLFQMANLFFIAAFCVPPSFKQSILLVRALLTFGFLFCTLWGGIEICAYDILLWNLLLTLLNLLHTVLLTWRFLPPALTLELTDLYLKVFKPLRVSKKHFKELTREAQMMTLERGDIYAVEDVSSADERLSILLKGKLRVTCDDTHLHFINAHQFVDSPEWESNHEQSDDVFQVTITAEEDSVYLCWPRMRLERILRHRPTLKVVLDSIIGKDITQKLYSLNEHIRNSTTESERLTRKANENHWMPRSMSVDAVHTAPSGNVRSLAWRTAHLRRPSITYSDRTSPARHHAQYWTPVVANHFMPTSPFTTPRVPTTHYPITSATTPLLPPPSTSSILLSSSDYSNPYQSSTDGLLAVPHATPPSALATGSGIEKRKLFRNSFRRHKEQKAQVKFQKEVQEVCYDSLTQISN